MGFLFSFLFCSIFFQQDFLAFKVIEVPLPSRQSYFVLDLTKYQRGFTGPRPVFTLISWFSVLGTHRWCTFRFHMSTCHEHEFFCGLGDFFFFFLSKDLSKNRLPGLLCSSAGRALMCGLGRPFQVGTIQGFGGGVSVLTPCPEWAWAYNLTWIFKLSLPAVKVPACVTYFWATTASFLSLNNLLNVLYLIFFHFILFCISVWLW